MQRKKKWLSEMSEVPVDGVTKETVLGVMSDIDWWLKARVISVQYNEDIIG